MRRSIEVVRPHSSQQRVEFPDVQLGLFHSSNSWVNLSENDRKTTQDIGWSSFSKFSLRKWPFYGPQFLNKKNKPVEDTACRLLMGTAVGEILLAWQGSEAPCLVSCPIAGMYTTVTLSVYIWCTDMEVLYGSYILDIDDVHIHIWYIVFKDIHLPPGEGCRPEVDHVPNFWRFVWGFSGECV